MSELDVLTAEEAARFLRVDVRTLRDAIRRGEVPAQRLGRRGVIRIARGALLQQLGARQDQAPPSPTSSSSPRLLRRSA
jgi:excisionase family DNA binding protein